MLEVANQTSCIVDLCYIQIGYNARGRLQPADTSGRLTVQARDIDPDGRFDPTALRRFALPDVPDRYLVYPGDVLFRSRGDRTTATIVEGLDEPAIAILPLLVLRPRTTALDPRFLAWAINQPAAQRHFDVGAQGQNLRMIPRPCLASLEIDLPDLTTQRAIVTLDELSGHETRLAIRLANLKRQRIAAVLADAARRHAMEPA